MSQIFLGGKPVQITEPVQNGQVLKFDATADAWINVASTSLEISICGAIPSPDHDVKVIGQGGEKLEYNAEDQVWQPETFGQ
jgi:hypothetical protein